MTSHPRLRAQFMPAALAIQAAPPPPLARAILWTLLLLLILSISWATTSRVDIVSVATGKLIPVGQVKTVQSLSTGVVTHIYVSEGQRVQKGDLLIALDTTLSRADITRLENELVAVADDIVVTEYLLLMAQENQLPDYTKKPFWSRLKAASDEFKAQKAAHETRLKAMQSEKKAAEVNVNLYQKTLPLISKRVASIQALNNDSLASTDQLLQLKQEHIQQEESLALQIAQVEQIEDAISAAKQDYKAFIAEKHNQYQQQQVELVRRKNDLEQQLTKARQTGAQQLLKAPVSGVVTQLMVTTVGGVVSSAQELMQIVPSDEGLWVTAGLKNKDIGFVVQGQAAEIKLEAFPFTQYGVIQGTVAQVSADAIEQEDQGLMFPIKVELQQEQILVNGHWVKLQPGMQATVEVKTGERRIIAFLLAPILKGLDESVRER